MLKATIERPRIVNAYVFNLIATAQAQESLQKAEAVLDRGLNPIFWMVGHGGSHVWLKRVDSRRRVAIIKDHIMTMTESKRIIAEETERIITERDRLRAVNARLVEALELMVNTMHALGGSTVAERQEAARQARAALAQAKGE